MSLKLRTLRRWTLKSVDPARTNNIRPHFSALTHYTSDNTSKLAVGITQRDNVLPKTPLQVEKSGIGYIQPNVITEDYMASIGNTDAIFNPPVKLRERHVRIFVPDHNHMQSTPKLERGSNWAIQFERQAVYKTNNMGWTFSNDTFSSGQTGGELTYFDTLEEAVQFCRTLGVGYDIKYPKHRYVTVKDYASNFKWKGLPPKAEDIA